MKLNKKTVLQRAANLEIKIGSGDNIEIRCGNIHCRGNRFTLSVLTAFTTPLAFEAGLTALTQSLKSAADWVALSGHIQYLADWGILVPAESIKPALVSHNGRFDASDVHIRMLNDVERTLSYKKAIFETVEPDDIVVDIGTGTGVLAAFAAMAGAKQVYAVERTCNMPAMARQLFERNGLTERIKIIEGHSTSIELPEKADVMVSELIGNDPLQENVLTTVQDAEKRLLKPDARQIPQTLDIYALPVTLPSKKIRQYCFTKEAAARWQTLYGLDFSSFVEASETQNHAGRCNTFQAKNWSFLSKPVLLKSIDLAASQPEMIQSAHQVSIINSGRLNGILVYFELQLSPNVRFSIHPEKAADTNHWASKVWIPGSPLAVETGQRIKLDYEYSGDRGSVFCVAVEK